MKNGKEFAEKMFSEMENNNNEVQEKLYSTGSEELDAMLEKAFSEGYEYAQKEFASARQRKKNAKNAVSTVNRVVSGEITAEQANKELGKIQARQGSSKVLNIQAPSEVLEELRMGEGLRTQGMKKVGIKAQKSEKQARHLAEGIGNGNPVETAKLTQRLNKNSKGSPVLIGAGRGVNAEFHVMDGGFQNKKQARVEPSQVRKDQMARRAERQKQKSQEKATRRAQQKQEAKARQQKAAEERSKKLELGKQKQQEQIKNAKEYQASKPKPNTTSTSKPTTTPTKPTTPTPSPKPNSTLTPTPKPKQKEVAEGFIKKNWNKLGKGGKIAAVAVPTVAAVGTGIAIKRNKKNK